MAVAFDSVGPAGGAGAGNQSTATLSWTHTVIAGGSTTGLVVFCNVDIATDTGVTATAKIDGVLMASLGVVHAAGGTNGFIQAWWTLGVSTGAHTILITPSTSPDDLEGGSIAVTGAGSLGGTYTGSGNTTTSTVILTTTHNGGLCVGGAGVGDNVNSTTSPSTSRYVINLRGAAGDAVGNAAGATSPSTGSSVTMSWGTNTASYGTIAVEVLPAALTASDPRYVIPGLTWLRYFRKTQINQLTPGPVMTQANAITATASVAAIGPTTIINSLAIQPPAYPGPTWKKHFQSPQQQQLSGPPPLCFAPAQTATATVSASLPSFTPYITGLLGGPHGHFVDQYNQPRLYFAAVPWGMPANAGRWNGGNWRLDFDTYFADIKAQGMTAAEMHPFGHSHTGCNNDLGNTWDGVTPFTTLPTLNNSFWQRIDYLVSSAAAQGISIWLVLNMQCDMGVDAFAGTGVFNGVSAANVQTACQNIAARYASQPNLVFFQGDDYNNDDDTRMQAVVDGLHAGGYTGPIGTEEYSSGTTSRRDLSGSPTGTPFTFGGANSTFNWCYYYAQTYFAVEFAYQENNQIPVVWGDGFYVGGGAGEPADAHLMRNFVWWALASGARGVGMGSEAILQWPSGVFTNAVDGITTNAWYNTSALAVYTAFTGLPGWWNLLPDLNNKLVTAGRGTRSGYSASNFQAANLGSDNYVAASITPDGSLAVIYCAVAMTITIDQTQLGVGYTATWIDPATGATQAATPGSTFDSTPLGNNSANATDWVLVLQGPAVVHAGGAAAGLPGQTWLRRFHHLQQPLPPAPVVTFTNATAGLASATAVALGQDQGANIASVAPNAAVAATTGTSLGQDQAANIAMVSPNAALAPGTGTARGFDTGDMLPGVAYPPQQALPGQAWVRTFRKPQYASKFTPQVAPQLFAIAGLAAATGTAQGQDTGANIAMVSPNAGLPAATGTSLGQDQGANIAMVSPAAGLSVGTGTARGFDTGDMLPGVAYPPQAAQVGQVWRRYYQHEQQWLPIPPAPTGFANAPAGLASATGTALGQDQAANIAFVSAADQANPAAVGTARGEDTGDALPGVSYPPVQAYPGQVWRKAFQHQQQPVPPAPFDVYPLTASATGTALGQDTGANIANVGPNGAVAAATGVSLGQDQGVNDAFVTVNAATAAATGTALGASTAVPAAAPAQAYPGGVWRHYFQHPQQPLGVAPAQAVSVTAGLASATGTALGVDTGADIAFVSPNAGLPAATGTSLGQDQGADTASVSANAGVAAATGAATGQNAASVAVNAGLATGTGTALNPGTSSVAPPVPAYAYPGPAWRKHFLNPQQWRPFVPPPPPLFIAATGSATVTDPREGVAAPAVDTDTAVAGVSDPREGLASVH